MTAPEFPPMKRHRTTGAYYLRLGPRPARASYSTADAWPWLGFTADHHCTHERRPDSGWGPAWIDHYVVGGDVVVLPRAEHAALHELAGEESRRADEYAALVVEVDAALGLYRGPGVTGGGGDVFTRAAVNRVRRWLDTRTGTDPAGSRVEGGSGSAPLTDPPHQGGPR